MLHFSLPLAPQAGTDVIFSGFNEGFAGGMGSPGVGSGLVKLFRGVASGPAAEPGVAPGAAVKMDGGGGGSVGGASAGGASVGGSNAKSRSGAGDSSSSGGCSGGAASASSGDGTGGDVRPFQRPQIPLRLNETLREAQVVSEEPFLDWKTRCADFVRQQVILTQFEFSVVVCLFVCWGGVVISSVQT